MSKELRANLIFFLILLVLILPGFVILMRKKLGGTTDPNYLPVPAPHAAAFIQPPPVPPAVPRVEPPEVRKWVQTLLTTEAGPAARLFQHPHEQGPVVGDAFRSHLIYLQQDGATPRLIALIWDQNPRNDTSEPILTARSGEQTAIPSQQKWRTVAVPKEVRHKLQNAGYVNPPETIWMVDATFADLPTPSAIITQYTGRDGKAVTETIELKQ